MLIEAWDRFLASPNTYEAWESKNLEKLLAVALSN
jgi:hypothetical protein